MCSWLSVKASSHLNNKNLTKNKTKKHLLANLYWYLADVLLDKTIWLKVQQQHLSPETVPPLLRLIRRPHSVQSLRFLFSYVLLIKLSNKGLFVWKNVQLFITGMSSNRKGEERNLIHLKTLTDKNTWSTGKQVLNSVLKVTCLRTKALLMLALI